MLFKRKDNEPKGNKTVMLMVLIADSEPLDGNRIASTIRNTFPNVRCQHKATKQNGIELEIAGESVVLALMPAPVPNDEVEHNVPFSRLWKGDPGGTAHKAHVIVVALGSSAPMKLATVAGYAAAGISESRETVGWYVGSASHVITPNVATACLKGNDIMPIMIWANIVMSRDSSTECSLSTIGMEALGHREFEIVRTHGDAGDWMFRIYDLCNYVLAKGPVFKAGQTFGESASERFLIEEGASKLGKDGTVIRLVVP